MEMIRSKIFKNMKNSKLKCKKNKQNLDMDFLNNCKQLGFKRTQSIKRFFI